MHKPCLPSILIACLGIVLGMTSCSKANTAKDVILSFDSPASYWEETFPLGNGRLGAMPTGEIAHESIVLNEESMWSGMHWDSNNPEAAKWLPIIREKLLQGDNVEAEKLMNEHFVCLDGGSTNPKYGCYQTLGLLEVDLNGYDEEPVSYKRELLFNEGISKTVAMFSDGNTITKEYFVSLDDDVVIVYLHSSKKDIDFSFNISREQNASVESLPDGSIQMYGHLPSGEEGVDGIYYYCRALSQPLSNNEAVIFLSAATTYNNDNPETKVNTAIDNAKAQNYSTLKQKQQKSFREYFDRVSVTLPDQKASQYLQFGRYLSIASTAKATLPPNLQGIWANDYATAWNGDYHLNINLEMNCWPMEVGNLSDLSGPITDFVESLVPAGEQTAKVFYDSPGWTAAVLANAWQFTSPAETPSWGSSLTGGAWISLQLWEHYLYSEDKDYLERIYPTLKGAAEFLQSNLFEFPVGDKTYLVTGPSTSPENSYFIDGKRNSVCAGPYMDTQICSEIFRAVIKASSILKKDDAFASSLSESLSRLAPMQISKNGYLQEWLTDYQEVEPTHRHVSHLFGLYPGTSIDTPELKNAARETLNRRGDEGTGWSRAWKICFWARIGDGNRAYKLFNSLMSPVEVATGEPDQWGNTKIYTGAGAGTFPNLFCAHPPFQIDGNFGGSAGLMEMLLQSHDGAIDILPAIPDSWTEGSFKGLKARGNITVDCTWKNGVATVTLLSKEKKTVKVRYKGNESEETLKKNRPTEVFYKTMTLSHTID